MVIKRRALRHDVRDGLVRSIIDGEYGPGERLIEMQIAREYGTSQVGASPAGESAPADLSVA